MELLPKGPSLQGPPEFFTGVVWRDLLRYGDEHARAVVNRMYYAPGARSAWHSHPNGQTIHALSGRGLVQGRGSEIIEVHPGDTVFSPPGEWHWHGAHPDYAFSHLSVTEVLSPGQEGPEVIWGEHVEDGSEPSE